MLDVLREHEIEHAHRALTLVDAIAAGVSPAFCGDQGMPAFQSFVDQQRDVIRKPTAEEESAAEERAWREFEASIA